MKVAVVGMSASCADAPWDDASWEKWGLPWHEGYWRQMDRHFEMHDMRILKSKQWDYLERLKECEHLYMQEAYFPGATRYPFEAVAKTTGDYWNSSIAYVMALAIHEGADEIGVFGVDMKADDEYGYQRPNMEYLIGLAIGRGIKVHVPDSSPLLKFFNHVPTYVKRYGWLG